MTQTPEGGLLSTSEGGLTSDSTIALDSAPTNMPSLLHEEVDPQSIDQPNPNSDPIKEAIEEEEEGVNLLNEASSVVGGGAIDAVESIGGFAELTGDTIKTGMNALLGKQDNEQNPFSKDYAHSDAGWLEIPDEIRDKDGNVIWEDAQPKTALGQFGRGLVEFGLLTWGTAGIGGAALGGARIGARGIAAARSMGVGARGTRYLKLIGKGAKIGSEGAIADLISNSSEHANIMNLANDHIPWAVPIIGDMIAVKPEDNPWTARFKTIAAGAGLNYVGHAIGAIYKGFWEAGRAKIAGKSIDEANVIGNEASAEDFTRNMELDETNHVDMALDDYQQGRGLSRAEPLDEFIRSYNPERYDEFATKRTSDLDEDVASVAEIRAEAEARGAENNDFWDEDSMTNTNRALEDLDREVSPFVNDTQFSQTQRATYRAPENAVEKNLSERIESKKAGGDGSSYSPIISENYLRRIARGDDNIYQYIKEVADDISDAAFRSVDNRLSQPEVKRIILEQANELLDIIENGGDIAKNLKNALDKPNAYRLYADDGVEIVTISPTQKAANVLVMDALGKQIHGIATGAIAIADNTTIGRQADMIFDQLKVLLKENKKMGLMWGLDGKAQQEFILPKTLERMKKQNLKEINFKTDQYISELRKLIDQERWQELEDLTTLFQLSGGKVRVIDHINEYLQSILTGGRMDDIHIKGRVRKELQGAFFNSVLSSFSTPVKAVTGTGMITMLRPLQAWLGAGFAKAITGRPMDRRSMFMAASQFDNMNKAWAESIQMAKHNWDLGVKRKNQTYQGKFDYEADIQQWKGMKEFYERYGTPGQKMAYGAMDVVVNVNTHPALKYSANAMGAGDAAARTMIGRQYARMKSAGSVWDAADGNYWDMKRMKQLAVDGEDAFMDEIFKTDQYGKRVVSHKGASMAGAEATMTTPLEENFKGFELLSNIPGMKAFFPFVRTGFNYLDVTFQHTPLNAFRDKFLDLKKLAKDPNPSPILLNKYGIDPDMIHYELALAEGRMAMGTAIIGLGVGAALSGRMTGSMPVNKEDRDLWKLNGIQPHSYKLSNGTYVSFEKLEIFNTILTTTANVVGHSDILGEKLTDEWLKKLTFMTSAVLVDNSMLGGVEDLARLMNPQSSEDLLLQSGTRYLRSHLPYAGLMGQIGDVVDANQREANTFLEMLSRRDAGFRQAIPLKYDFLSKDRSGKPLRYGPEQPLHRLFNSLAPIGFFTPDGDEVKENLMAMNYNLPEETSTYRGEVLNSMEKSHLERELAKGGLRKDLERVMRNPAFKKAVAKYKSLGFKESDGYKLRDQAFYKAIQQVFKYHKALAMQALIAKNAGLRARLAVKGIQKEIGKTSSYSQRQKEQIEMMISGFPK